MASAIGVDQALAEDHVAAALAIDHTVGPAQARQETAVAGQPAGMEFRVAAGEKDGVGMAVGRLVGEGREEADCGAGPPPALKHMGIGEPEGHIAGDRDGLAEGRERRRRPGTGGECCGLIRQPVKKCFTCNC